MVASSGRDASPVIAHSTPKSPSPSATMPATSSFLRRRSPRSRSTRAASASATAPIGTLIQKIHCHDTQVTTTPPSRIPRTEPNEKPKALNP